LHHAVYQHQSEMVSNGIISRDLYQSRKHVHVFSVGAQISGFVVEMVYLFGLLVVRMVGRRFFSANILEINNTLKTTQFGVSSTVEVLMSPTLRQKLLALIKRN
jgi:hypothetical protein